jgi:DNA helicase-2/ATP-dependent DNA helicase PcrA
VQSAREEGSDAIWLSDFLATVALLTDQDNPHDADVPRVTLMTVHSAKGLEFDTVFVVGLEEDLFPSNMAETQNDVEEERRLFYVAITRAEKRCLLTYAKTRFRYGQLQFGTRSRFLNEIDPTFLKGQQVNKPTGQQTGWGRSRDAAIHVSTLGGRTDRPTTPRPTTPLPTPTPRRWISLGERDAQSGSQQINRSTGQQAGMPHATSSPLPGARVEHDRFGQGEVVRVEGNNENAKAVIRFDNVGEKTLLLKFARLKIL